jgi:RNA polymerase sigma-70 factor (ECF subfamily)
MNERLTVLLAQTGDREAFDALLRSVQEPLFRYILRITQNRAAAEDTLQDVFLIIFRKLQWLNDPDLFRPWAYRIATRAAWKRMKFDPTGGELPESSTSPDIDVMNLKAQLPELLGRLSPASRAVLTLHYLDDLSLPEVAAILDVALGTVKSRLAYGLVRLREELNV